MRSNVTRIGLVITNWFSIEIAKREYSSNREPEIGRNWPLNNSQIIHKVLAAPSRQREHFSPWSVSELLHC